MEFTNEELMEVVKSVVLVIEAKKEQAEKMCTSMIGKYCIVRGRCFGVFAGTVEAVEGNRCLLKNARRLWYWDGAASLSQLAMEGVKAPGNCKFTVPVESVLLLDVIEIIPATEQARVVIDGVKVWKR